MKKAAFIINYGNSKAAASFDMVKYLTKEGLEKLKKELTYLKTVARKEVQERIRQSAAHGDLKENAGYHAAKEDQSFIEGRIAKLSELIASAQVLESPSVGGEKSKVQMGSIVSLKSKDGQNKYQVVDPEEADISTGKISFKSSLGEALLGRKKGDVVKFNTPDGVKEYKITDVLI